MKQPRMVPWDLLGKLCSPGKIQKKASSQWLLSPDQATHKRPRNGPAPDLPTNHNIHRIHNQNSIKTRSKPTPSAPWSHASITNPTAKGYILSCHFKPYKPKLHIEPTKTHRNYNNKRTTVPTFESIHQELHYTSAAPFAADQGANDWIGLSNNKHAARSI